MTDERGPEVDHDTLLGEIEARNREDADRASSAGESRQKIGEFLDETGLNSQAYSWMRSIVKKLGKNDGQNKAMDIIRSIEVALPMVKSHVQGQTTEEMDFDRHDPETIEEPESDGLTDEEMDERAEFDDAVDVVTDDDGNVMPFEARG